METTTSDSLKSVKLIKFVKSSMVRGNFPSDIRNEMVERGYVSDYSGAGRVFYQIVDDCCDDLDSDLVKIYSNSKGNGSILSFDIVKYIRDNYSCKSHIEMKKHIASKYELSDGYVRRLFNKILKEFLCEDSQTEEVVESELPDTYAINTEWDNYKQDSAKFEAKSDKEATAESTTNNIRTLDDLLKVCNVDLNYWEVERHVINKWEVAAKDANGELQHSPLFQVKAWLKKKKTQDIREVVQFMKDELAKIAPKSVQKKSSNEGSYLYEISIPDLHLAKMGWDQESGHHYDVDVACDLFKDAVSNLIGRISNYDVEKIVLPIGNDFFNSDNGNNTTTKGTPQQDAARWQQSFAKGCKLVVDVADELTKKYDLDIVVVPGNHDRERNYYLGEYLSAWFRNNGMVNVENSPNFRKYYEYGENIILFTHGNNEKQSDLPMLMATECKNFSLKKFKTAHLGHFHQFQVKESFGVSVKILPSLCPADAWHDMKGFVGNKRSAMGFLYSKTNGEVANYFYNL